MYSDSILSSIAVHARLFKPPFEKQALLPIFDSLCVCMCVFLFRDAGERLYLIGVLCPLIITVYCILILLANTYNMCIERMNICVLIIDI